jgi:hypothetical protein
MDDDDNDIPCPLCGEEAYDDDVFCGGLKCDNESFMRSYGTFHEHDTTEGACDECIRIANAEAHLSEPNHEPDDFNSNIDDAEDY